MNKTQNDYSRVINTKPLAYGRKSRIYTIDNTTILKLYDAGFPVNKIKREYENTKIVYGLDRLLVPKPLDFIELGKQTGIVYEKIEGISLMDLFQKNPLYYFSYGKKIAALHKSIHRIKTDLLPSQNDVFNDCIVTAHTLSDTEKTLLLKILRKKNESSLCHGDFHHGNIMVTPNGDYFILDWMDAFSGDYLLDVALTAVNGAISDAPTYVPFLYRKAYDLLKKILALDKEYIKLYGKPENKMLDEYLFLSAGIHLARFGGGKINNYRLYFASCKKLIHKQSHSS